MKIICSVIQFFQAEKLIVSDSMAVEATIPRIAI